MGMETFLKTEEQQQEHADTLKDCFNVLVKNKLTPILSGSSLLAWRREGDFLQWYPPGSVLIIRYEEIKSEQQQEKIIEDLKNANLEIYKYFKKPKGWKITVKRGLWIIEITGFHKAGKNYARQVNRKRIKTIPKTFLTAPFSEVELRGQKYIAPLNVDEYLDHLYIDWKIPNQSGWSSEFRNKKYSRRTDI